MDVLSRMAQLVAHVNEKSGGTGFDTQSNHILSWNLIMKSLCNHFPFHLFTMGSCHLLANVWALSTD